MEKKVIIYGAGGHAKVILDIFQKQGREILGFIDDDLDKKGLKIANYEILGGIDSYMDNRDQLQMIVGIGDNKSRNLCQAKASGFEIINAIHPQSIMANSVIFGKGIAIMGGVVINSDTSIGDGVIVNTSSSVDHDCTIGVFTHIAPGVSIAGEVTIGDNTLVGIGAKILPGISVGSNVIIGGGAVITKNIPDFAKVVGVPGRIIN